MTSDRAFIEEVRDRLVANIDTLAQELFPDGHYANIKKYWIARNPSRDDRNPGSFWIWLSGAKAGGWCDAASGQKGDVFSLINLGRGDPLDDFREAMTFARKWTGLDPAATPAERQQRQAQISETREKRAQEEAELLAKARRRAKAIWLDGAPLGIKGEPNPKAALAFRYFEGRGIDLMRLPRLPGATRLLFDQPHQESGRTYAALGSCVIDADGQFLALHRVFITDDGRKIPQKPYRKCWPEYAGGFIPIWDGGTGLSPKKAAAIGLLTRSIIGEGIEDGYANAIGKPDRRVFAAVSLSNLANFPALACIDDLTVFQDNDWGKPQARAQLLRACETLDGKGLSVRLAASYLGKDANDLMNGE